MKEIPRPFKEGGTCMIICNDCDKKVEGVYALKHKKEGKPLIMMVECTECKGEIAITAQGAHDLYN
jgi:hypothetical protein